MKEKLFIKKPVLALLALILVAAGIFFIERQKIDLGIETEPVASNVTLSNLNYTIDLKIDQEKSLKYSRAAEIVGVERWINSEPLKIANLKGKVVLVDFWTYTCINCIRTLPYLKAWDEKYRGDGLVIIGVHSPEFEFEKKYGNLLKFVNDYNIKYAVGQDNNFATWKNYKNHYWPHKFLIDIDGYVRYDHIGEGGYDKTEKMIQELLNERKERMKEEGDLDYGLSSINSSLDFANVKTPEIYFGYQFARGNLGFDAKPDEVKNFQVMGKILRNTVYLNGQWKNNADNMELVSDSGEIILIYDAKHANIVAGSDNSSKIDVMMDNSYLTYATKGDDVAFEGNKSVVNVDEFKLYNVASAEKYGEHFLSLKVSGKGFKIYTFTFG